jgi:hypothetical protein
MEDASVSQPKIPWNKGKIDYWDSIEWMRSLCDTRSGHTPAPIHRGLRAAIGSHAAGRNRRPQQSGGLG